MRHVAHFVPVAQTDAAAESVLHDAQMIPVVHDVGGELGAIAPPDDALLARARGFPVHFQLELVRFDETWRLVEPLSERPEEEQESMRPSPVIVQRGVGRGARSPRDGAVGEGAGVPRVPSLRTGRGREQQGGKRRYGHYTHSHIYPLAAPK